MKYIALCVVLTCIASAAYAQTDEYVFAKLSSGIYSPQRPDAYSNLYGAGPGFGVSLAYGLSFGLELAVSATYARLPVDEAHLLAVRGYTGGEFSADIGAGRLYGAALESRLYLAREFWALYVLGGGGIQRLLLADGEVTGPGGAETLRGESHSGPALHAGLGLMVPLSRVLGFFGEASYEVMFAEERRFTLPVKFGIVVQLSDSY